MAYWQQQEKIDVPGSGSATFTLKSNAPLERLTIWAVSGDRVLVSMTFQPQINGENFGSASSVVGAKAADVIYASGGAAAEDLMVPFVHPDKVPRDLDRFVFSVKITNNDATTASVTMLAAAVAHQG
jgi:hypothetical protein